MRRVELRFVRFIGATLLLCGIYVFAADEVTSKQQLQDKYPNVWLKIFPDATKLRLLGMYSYSINTLYPDGTIVKHPDVLMRVRKINEQAEYLISFFYKKEYLIDDKTLTNIPVIRHQYKEIEIDGNDPIRTVATKLLDGTWVSIHSRYNSNSRWSFCMPVDQRIARLSIKNDNTDTSELNLNQIKVEWMKSIIIKIDKNDEEESCHGFKKHDSVIRDFIDLKDGTLLLQGAQYIIRIRIADGSSLTHSRNIKIVDDKNAAEFYSYIWNLDKCWEKQNVRDGKSPAGVPIEELAISYFFDRLKFINNIKKECSHGDH